jgi:hypothetical protein
MQSSPTVRITGTFSVEELAGDFSHERYAFARRLGDSVGSISVDNWRTVEPLLKSLWRDRDGEPTWEQARPAIYLAWKQSQQLNGGKAESGSAVPD